VVKDDIPSINDADENKYILSENLAKVVPLLVGANSQGKWLDNF
jgi:hypothetical protein